MVSTLVLQFAFPCGLRVSTVIKSYKGRTRRKELALRHGIRKLSRYKGTGEKYTSFEVFLCFMEYWIVFLLRFLVKKILDDF